MASNCFSISKMLRTPVSLLQVLGVKHNFKTKNIMKVIRSKQELLEFLKNEYKNPQNVWVEYCGYLCEMSRHFFSSDKLVTPDDFLVFECSRDYPYTYVGIAKNRDIMNNILCITMFSEDASDFLRWYTEEIFK